MTCLTSLIAQDLSCRCFSVLLHIAPFLSQTVFVSPPAPCSVGRAVSTSVRFSWQAVGQCKNDQYKVVVEEDYFCDAFSVFLKEKLNIETHKAKQEVKLN